MLNQEQYNSHFINTINQKIMRQIQQGHLKLSTNKKHVEHKNSQNQFLQTLSNQSNSPIKRQKSSLSLQDRKLLHKLTQKLHTFQSQITNKSETIKQIQYAHAKQELKKILQKRKTQLQKNKQKVIERKHKRQVSKLQRQKKKQLQQSQHKLYSKSRFYIICQAQHAQKMRLQEQQRKRLLALMSEHKNSLVKISKIKEYQSSYGHYLMLQKEQRKNKIRRMRQSQRILEEISRSKSAKSKYYLRLQQQIENQKIRLEEQTTKKIEQKRKLKQFLQRIVKPTAMVQKKESTQTNTPARRVERSYTQQKQIGNKFMKQSFNVIRSNKPKVQKTKQFTITQSTRTQKHNYLLQMKERRLKNKNNSNNTILAHNKTAINAILNSSQNIHQKIQIIKRLAHQLQAGLTNGDPQIEIQKIKAKMFILQSALKNQDT